MPVTVVCSDNDFDTRGVNTPQQLEELERQHQLALADQLMTVGCWSMIVRGSISAAVLNVDAMFVST